MASTPATASQKASTILPPISTTQYQDHYNSDSARKRRKYQSGGPGGLGRWTSNVNGHKSPLLPPSTQSRRGTQPDVPTYDSAAQAAAVAAGQVDGYKPREERSWEEFHPDLDINAKITTFTSAEVDGAPPNGPPDQGNIPSPDSSNPAFKANGKAPPGSSSKNAQAIVTPPPKRRPGRPPRRPESMLSGLGSPPTPKIVPLPAHNPRERLNLPKPSYRKVETFASFETDQAVHINYVDRTMAHVGFQESEMYLRPEGKLVRLEMDTALPSNDANVRIESEKRDSTANAPPVVSRVEYDMDEQDERWLEAQNLARKDEQVEAIKPAIFEITMTQIEKEWHALEKKIPKPNPKPPQTHRPRSSSAAAVNGEPAGAGEEQDSKCAVCDDGECENSNAIVFCDGCDLAVHQECYGVPFIPEGQWLCRKCQLIGRGVPTCIFCPNTDGAFKTTHESKWSHLICAIWIPEVTLANSTFMEPVMDVASVPKQRWRLNCYICNQKMGACIQCGNRNCFQAFHVTCGRRAKLYLKMKSTHGGPASLDASVLKAYCDKHVPHEWARSHDVESATSSAKDHYRRTMKGRRWADSQQSALAMLPAQQYPSNDLEDDNAAHEDPSGGANAAAQKRRRLAAQKNVWRLASGAPIVPQVVFDAVAVSLQRFGVRKRKDFAAECCKYWTLKREARRGASLLKRLQLQMETFSSTEITRRNFVAMGSIGRSRLQRRIEMAELLIDDLASLRVICNEVRERGKLQSTDAALLNDMVDTVYFPIISRLQPILRKAQHLDSKNFFLDGLESLQKRFRLRHYVSVVPFVMDLTDVLRTPPRAPTAESSKATAGDETLTNHQKEVKKIVKRIAKALQQPLHDAIRQESELVGLPLEEQWDSIEAALVSLHDVGDKQRITFGGQDEHGKHQGTHYRNENAPLVDSTAVSQARAVEVADREDATDPQTNGWDYSHQSEMQNSQVDGPDLPGSAQGPSYQGIEEQASPTQLHGSTTHYHGKAGRHAPNDGFASSLAAGGTPWYLQNFRPAGIEIQDEWDEAGGEQHRPSEELSEMGDEELKGLGGDFASTDGEKAPVETKKTPSKKRKRNRSYW